MADALARLKALTQSDAAKMIAHVARLAGRDPLTALGVPMELAMTPDVAMLVFELVNPPKGQKSESEYDEKAEAMKEGMDLRDSWLAAISTGYTGPRGQHTTKVRCPVAPEPAPLVPCLF